MRSIDKYSVFSVFIALLLSLSGGSVAAQTKFIQENQVTEEAMIRALKPAEPIASPSAEPSGLTRSLKVTPHDPSKPGATSRKPPKPAKAQAASGSAPVLLTFEPNATELTDKAKRALDIIARSLAHAELASLSFAIEGHADPRGNPNDNLKLSSLRAESVKTYLVSQHGIADKRLQAVGKGDTQLAVPQHPAAAENRRVTFVTLQ
jgi:OmpA-OmpF porin, OOP family